MQIDIKLMPADEADAVRRNHERNANFLHGVQHKFKKTLGIATHNPANSHKNEVLETVDIKAWDKQFKKENKITIGTIGDKNYSDFEISFVSKDEIKKDKKLYELHLNHLANIYDDIEEWFKTKFGKIPMVSCIHGDEDVPHINIIFNNFRRNEDGKYYASKYSFFNFEKLVDQYPEYKNKKINSSIRKEILSKVRHEFFEKFGKPIKADEEAATSDKNDIASVLVAE